MRRGHLLISLLTALGVCALGLPAAAQSFSFQQAAAVTLTGAAGHGDWVDYDAANGDLYVAHHGDGVNVVDSKTDLQVATVTGIKGPNGIAHDDKYVYVAAGDGNQLVVIDKASWKIVAAVKTKGTTPDGIWVDSDRGLVYVASDDNNWIEVYNGGSAPSLKTTWALEPANPKAGPDVGTLVDSKGLLYMPDDAMVEALDLSNNGKVKLAVDTGVPLTSKGGTKNMVYDPVRNVLWVNTTAKKILILNADTLATVASVPLAFGADQIVLDPGLRVVYSFGGQGFAAYNADTMQTITSYVKTGSDNTHTGNVNPSTHHVYAYEGNANLLADYTPYGQSLPKTGESPVVWLGGLLLVAAGLALGLRRRLD